MIFRHRRLLCLSLFAVLCIAITGRLPFAAGPVFLVAALLAAAALLPFAFRHRRLRVVLLALLLLIVSLLSVCRVSDTRRRVAAKDGETLSLTATVLRVTRSEENSFTAEGTVSLPTALGKREVRVRLLFPSEEEIRAGDRIHGRARIAATGDGYLAARGVYATLHFDEVRAAGNATGIRTAVGQWSELLSRRIQKAVPGESGALYAAILLGDRAGLPDTVTRDMTRIGTVHILSVSGMHLMILTAGIGFLLRRLRLGKHLRLTLLSAATVFFMLLTGLSSSVLRAGFMFLFSVLPVFLHEERDSLTSLSVALAVILLLEPYAVGDLALWLSALSTLGILLYFDRAERKNEQKSSRWRRLLRTVTASFSITVSATVATLPFSLLLFGSLPLLSPVANLLLSPLIHVAMYLSLLLAIFGALPPLSFLARLLAYVILFLSERLAEIPRTVLAVEGGIPLLLALLLFVAVAAYFLFCPRKRFRLRVPVALLVLSAVILSFPPALRRIWRADGLSVTHYADTEARADCIYMELGKKRMLIPLSELAFQSDAEERVFRDAAGEVDALLLPYYTAGAADYALELLKTKSIRHLYLPTPFTQAERELATEILAFTNRERIPTTLYPTEAPFSFEGITVSHITVGGYGNATYVSLELLHGERRILYYGANAFRGATEGAKDADLILFGCFGGTVRQHYRNEDCIGADTHILCPSPAHLPFYDPSGISFSSKGSVILR